MHIDETPLVRVMALHALLYCERLFYLEEVEELRLADQNVWAGRRLHLAIDPGDEAEVYTLASSELGIQGRFDAVRKKSGQLVPLEHKRGGSQAGENGPSAWPSDEIQIVAYALLLQENLRKPIEMGQIFYHRDRQLVSIPISTERRDQLMEAVARARQLRQSVRRPPVTEKEILCRTCSLAPACLPEEQRHYQGRVALRLFPEDSERRSLHVANPRARVGCSGEALVVTQEDGAQNRFGTRAVEDVVLHGHPQISTQALRLCAHQSIPVHWVTTSGTHVGTFLGNHGGVQRRIRQFRGLSKRKNRLELARLTVQAKVEQQLKLLLRLTRSRPDRRVLAARPLGQLRKCLSGIAKACDLTSLIGYEGGAARCYFKALAQCFAAEVDPRLVPMGRSRRPPRDPFNCLLSFGYTLLYRDTLSCLTRVGLEPSLGFLHQPRSASFPLACDLMEIFRVPLVDTAFLAAVNRRTFEVDRDFVVMPRQVWLSAEGRKRAIEVYERRKDDSYLHPVLKYSLSFRRLIELEARLLEKEWSGEAGLYARMRLR